MNTVEKEPPLCSRLMSWRAVIVLLLHLSYCIFNIPVITTAMALVCMCGPLQRQANLTQGDGWNVSVESEFFRLDNVSTLQKSYEFDWEAETRGLLIASYTFGVFLVPHLANLIRSYLGNKMTLTAYAVVLATLSFLSPIAARTHVYFFLALRILSGLTVSSQIPVASDTLAWWIPAREKLTAATILIMGWMVSGMLLPLFAGYACLIPIDNGWPFIFYLNGTLCLLWAILWFSLSSRRPEDHPSISEAEKHYIVSRRIGMGSANRKVHTPYLTILGSRPVWGYVIASATNLWALVITLTCLPLYLTSVLQFSLQQTGVVLFLNAGLRILAALFWTALGNWLRNGASLSTNAVRKICVCTGQVLAAIFYLGTCFFDHEYKFLAAALVISATWVSMFAAAMPSVIPQDMAPRFSGFLSALGASCGSLLAISAPIFVTAVAPNGLFQEWRIIWLTMTAVHLLAAGVFMFFGEASLQPWAEPANEGTQPFSTSESKKLEENISLNTPENKT